MWKRGLLVLLAAAAIWMASAGWFLGRAPLREWRAGPSVSRAATCGIKG